MQMDPSEPENYSLDQMMDRLKDRSNPSQADKPNGEWVTRSDGSKAYKVRRRKRRSEQPHKQEAQQKLRSRAFQIVGVALFLIITGVLCAGLMIYVNTSGYREARRTLAERFLGAEVAIVQMSVMPTSAKMGNMTLTWPGTGVLRSLAAHQVNMQLRPTSFLGSVWRGDEVYASEVDLQVDRAGSEPASVDSNEFAGKSPFQFQFFRTPKLNLILGDRARPALALNASEAAGRFLESSALGELVLHRGQLVIAGWQPIEMDRALIQIKDDEVNVVNLYLRDTRSERSSIQLNGSFSLKDKQPANLQIKAQRITVETLLTSGGGGLLAGVMDTDDRNPVLNALSFTPGDFSSYQLVLSLQSEVGSSITLSGLPCLKVLAEMVREPWYERPSFDSSMSARLVRREALTSLQNIEGVAKNRMTLRGRIDVTAGQKLGGTLEIGVPSEILVSSEQQAALDAIFSQTRDGLRWATVNLSGTVQQPVDDLAMRLQQARQSAFRPASAPAKPAPSPAEQRFHELTR